MPTYEYVCTDCGDDLEVVQSIHADSLTICPSCGGKLRKVFGNVGVVFKGSGFYKTDSRAEAKHSKRRHEGGGAKGGDSGGGAGADKGSGAGKGDGQGGDKAGGGTDSGTGVKSESKSTGDKSGTAGASGSSGKDTAKGTGSGGKHGSHSGKVHKK